MYRNMTFLDRLNLIFDLNEERSSSGSPDGQSTNEPNLGPIKVAKGPTKGIINNSFARPKDKKATKNGQRTSTNH